VVQIVCTAIEHGQSALAIGYVGCCDSDGMRQPACVERAAALDAGDFFVRVVSFCPAVFFTLCVSTLKKLLVELYLCLAQSPPTDVFSPFEDAYAIRTELALRREI
jgi:hypothetical protein